MLKIQQERIQKNQTATLFETYNKKSQTKNPLYQIDKIKQITQEGRKKPKE